MNIKRYLTFTLASSNQGLNATNHNTLSGASSIPGLAAALPRSHSGGNVNNAPPQEKLTPSNIPPATNPRSHGPTVPPPTRNHNSLLNSTNGISGSAGLSSNNKPLEVQTSIPPRPVVTVSSEPPRVAQKNIPATMNKPSSTMNPTLSPSPRSSVPNMNNASNGSINRSSYLSNSSQSMSHTNSNIKDGRWLFHSDIPLPRQWPSGDHSDLLHLLQAC